jgi:hypothetical protein
MVLRRVVTGLGALTLLEIMFKNIGTHLITAGGAAPDNLLLTLQSSKLNLLAN